MSNLDQVTLDHITKSYRVLTTMVDNRKAMIKKGFRTVDPVVLYQTNIGIYNHARNWFESLSYPQKAKRMHEYVRIILDSMNMDIFSTHTGINVNGKIDPEEKISIEIFNIDNDSLNWKEIFSQYNVKFIRKIWKNHIRNGFNRKKGLSK